jgi:hypothetical protein
MAKRLGCLVLYRSNGRVTRVAKVELSPIGQEPVSHGDALAGGRSQRESSQRE